MRQALVNENADLVHAEPALRHADHRRRRRRRQAQLGNFIDPEAKYPVIVTTSRLLSTGVDAQTCRLIVLDREVGSMTEFKQIVGRGTRVHEDTKKYYFTLIDFRKATNHFADPDFDGEPVQIYEPGEDDPVTPPDDVPPTDDDEDAIPPEPGEDEIVVDRPDPDITMPPGRRRRRASIYINGERGHRSSPSGSSTSTKTASWSPRACATTRRRRCGSVSPASTTSSSAGTPPSVSRPSSRSWTRRACCSSRWRKKSARTSTPST